MAKRSCLITLSTTPGRLIDMLRGTLPAGASLSRTYGTQLNDQCREILIKCDANTVYIGDDSSVSSTDYGEKLLTGESVRKSDAENNTLNLGDHWLVGSGAGTKVAVVWVTV